MSSLSGRALIASALTALSVLAGAASAHAQATLPAENCSAVTTCETSAYYGRADLSFTAGQNGATYSLLDRSSLQLTYRRPAGTGPFPVVVLLHGGGWVGGAPSDMNAWAKYLNSQGYAVAMPRYLLMPLASTKTYYVPQWWGSMPVLVNASNTISTGNVTIEQISQESQREVQTAIRYLRVNATALKINKNKIYAFGQSAGGVTAIRVANRPTDVGDKTIRDFSTAQQAESSTVKAAGSLVGFECVPPEVRPATIPVQMSTGVWVTYHPGACTLPPKDANGQPIAGRAPFFMVNGTADPVVPITVARATCTAAGTKCAGLFETKPYATQSTVPTTFTEPEGTSFGTCFSMSDPIFPSTPLPSNNAPGGDHGTGDPYRCTARAGIDVNGVRVGTAPVAATPTAPAQAGTGYWSQRGTVAKVLTDFLAQNP